MGLGTCFWLPVSVDRLGKTHFSAAGCRMIGMNHGRYTVCRARFLRLFEDFLYGARLCAHASAAEREMASAQLIQLEGGSGSMG